MKFSFGGGILRFRLTDAEIDTGLCELAVWGLGIKSAGLQGYNRFIIIHSSGRSLCRSLGKRPYGYFL